MVPCPARSAETRRTTHSSGLPCPDVTYPRTPRAEAITTSQIATRPELVTLKYDGGRVGVFLRMHHAMADGVAAVAAFSALFDLTAGSPAPAAPPWIPAPVPSARELLGDNARRRARELDRALSGLLDPGGMLRNGRRTWPAWREAVARIRSLRTPARSHIARSGWPYPGQSLMAASGQIPRDRQQDSPSFALSAPVS